MAINRSVNNGSPCDYRVFPMDSELFYKDDVKDHFVSNLFDQVFGTRSRIMRCSCLKII